MSRSATSGRARSAAAKTWSPRATSATTSMSSSRRDQARECTTHHRLVFRDQDTDHDPPSGIVTRSRKPPSVRGPVDSAVNRASTFCQSGEPTTRAREPTGAVAVVCDLERSALLICAEIDLAVLCLAVSHDIGRTLADRPGEDCFDLVTGQATAGRPGGSRCPPPTERPARRPARPRARTGDTRRRLL